MVNPTNSNAYNKVSSSITGLTWKAFDKELIFGVSSNNVYKFNSNNNNYDLYYTETSGFLSTVTVFSALNRVFITSSSGSSAAYSLQINGYIDQSNTLTKFFTNLKTDYVSVVPKIEVSPSLTKIITIGDVTSGGKITGDVLFYFVNYTDLSIASFDQVPNGNRRSQFIYIKASDNFIYYRELLNPSITTTNQ